MERIDRLHFFLVSFIGRWRCTRFQHNFRRCFRLLRWQWWFCSCFQLHLTLWQISWSQSLRSSDQFLSRSYTSDSILIPLWIIIIEDIHNKRWNRYLLPFHQSHKRIPISPVVSYLISIVESEVFEVTEVSVPCSLSFNIILLVKRSQFVRQSYSSLLIIQDVSVASKRSMAVIFGNGQISVPQSVDWNNPLKNGILCPSNCAPSYNLIQNGISFDIPHKIPGSLILNPAIGQTLSPHLPSLGLKGKVDPAMKHKEDRMSNRQLWVTHEPLKIIVHGIMTIFHGIFVMLVICRHIVLEEIIRFLEQSLSILEMW